MKIPKWFVMVLIAIVAITIFDYAMRKDAERLCSNDATAYDECYNDA